MKGMCGLIAVCIAASVAMISNATAATFTVNSTVDAVDANIGNGVCATSTGACTLRAAIQEANALGGNDVIILPVGIYTLTIPGAGEGAAATGDLDIGSTITINGAGSGVPTTMTLSGSQVAPNPVVTTASGTATITVDPVTRAIRGFVAFSGLTGTATAALIHQAPAGVNGPTILMLTGDVGVTSGRFMISGTLTPAQMTALGSNGLYISVHSTVFPGGEIRGQIPASLKTVAVIDGGGLDRVLDISPAGSVIISGVTIQNGSESGGGGGIRSAGNLSLTDCMIRGNNAPGGIGGGISNSGTLTILASTVSDNAAGAGLSGGIQNSGSLTLRTSTVKGNFGGLAGGGIGNIGSMSVTDSTVSGNTGGAGGGINNGGTGTLTNVTISGNSGGTGFGGGISNNSNNLVLTNCTVSGNIAASGAGIANSAILTIKDTILSNGAGNCSGSLTSLGFNLSSDNSCSASFALATDLNNVDPLLGPLSHNGSSVQTHALRPGSPAIDTGDVVCPAMDQRGVARPQDGFGDRLFVCDRGAYEFRKDKIGAYRGGRWLLDYNGNEAWSAVPADSLFTFGLATDTPVSGDWDGDGMTEVGVFRSGRFILDVNGNGLFGPGVDKAFTFGLATDVPVTGDWNGDGITEVGVFRAGRFILDVNGNGLFDPGVDRAFTFGLATDVPVTGDWNGDGITEVGVFRAGRFILDMNGNGVFNPGVDRAFTFGLATDTPVTGNW